MNPDPLPTTAEAAELLHTPVGTLRYWRHQGTGPKGFRLGARRVMYRRSDVLAWLEEQYNAEQVKA
ncbi:Regulatory protein MerR (fragment) [Nostocoides australiense Ben110]|uniref:Regulatory protein MerR n=1 Tax=Nostocoides australiense Ben110 TaxID=1193182 RepID=W6K3L5_9MICO